MAKVYFITGNDTDAGKTFVSGGILEAVNHAGFSSAGIKPIAAGGYTDGNGFYNEDAVTLQRKSSLPLSYKQVNPVLFREGIAPHIAAAHNNIIITASKLASHCLEIMQKKADVTLIEGAGGWKVPLNDKEFISDMVKILNIPVVLVVPMKLGCINHTLLTAQAIQNDGLHLFGWVANNVQAKMQAYTENLNTLTKYLPAPLLAEIQYQPSFDSNSSCAMQIDPTVFV